MNEPKPQPRDIMSETPRTEHALDVASEISGDDDDEYYRAAAGTLSALARQLERELTQAQADLGLERESHEVTKRMLDDADHELTEGRTKWAQDLERANWAQARCAELRNMLIWHVNHEGECLGDHPELLEAASAALKEPR